MQLQIKQAFEKLKNAVGKDKIPVIQDIWEADITRRALYLLLNPLITFGVGEKSIAQEVNLTPTQFFSSILELCNAFEGKTSVTDQDIANVQHFMCEIKDNELQEFAEAFLTKTLTLGVAAKTVNKAVGYEAIPQFSCMLAEKYFEYPQAVDGKSFAITEKLDGIRCLAIVHSNKPPILYSRQGQIIQGLTDIEQDLCAIHNRHGIEFVLDGELLVTDRSSIPSKEQYKQTTKTVRKDGEKHGITFNVFDLIGVDVFENHNCDTPYYMRRQKLEVLCRDMNFISGKMFGFGVYFATKARKSLGYTSLSGSYWAHGNSSSAFMGLYDVAYGKPYDVYSFDSKYYSMDYDRLQKTCPGANCLHAHEGSMLRNDEIIVYQECQTTIKYLVELK